MCNEKILVVFGFLATSFATCVMCIPICYSLLRVIFVSFKITGSSLYGIFVVLHLLIFFIPKEVSAEVIIIHLVNLSVILFL